jgi:hypothetical protein
LTGVTHGGVVLPDIFAEQTALLVVGPDHRDRHPPRVHGVRVDAGRERGTGGLLVSDGPRDGHVVADGELLIVGRMTTACATSAWGVCS